MKSIKKATRLVAIGNSLITNVFHEVYIYQYSFIYIIKYILKYI